MVRQRSLLLLLRSLVRTFRRQRLFEGSLRSLAQLFVPVIVQCRPHTNIHRQPLARVAFVNAANGSNVAIIPPISDAYMPESDGRAKRGIVRKPS